jgi:hypothetical protein
MRHECSLAQEYEHAWNTGNLRSSKKTGKEDYKNPHWFTKEQSSDLREATYKHVNRVGR